MSRRTSKHTPRKQRWPSQKREAARRPLAVILIAYIVLAVAYSLVVPLGEGPDEAPHFTVIRYIVQNGHFPTTAEEHEAFQPPLYYYLGALVTAWADYDGYVIKANADYSLEPGRPHNLLVHSAEEGWPWRGWVLAWRILRWLSVALGAATILAVYSLGREVFPTVPATALIMAGTVAFNPAFLFLSAMVNNDNLATALSAFLLWRMARLVRGDDGWKNVILLGIGLGAAVLSKVSAGVTALPIGLALIYAAFQRERGDTRRALGRLVGRGAALAGMALLITGPWFLRNYQLFGDFTGWSFILQTNALREGPLTPAVLGWLVQGLFTSFWLRWIGVAMPPALYSVLLGVCVFALAGWVRTLARRPRFSRQEKVLLLLLALQILVVFGALLKWTATVLGTDQARLLYPALPAIALFLGCGLLSWFPDKRWMTAAWGWVGAFFILAVVSLVAFVAPVYAAPRPLEALPADAEPVGAAFRDAETDTVIELVGYRLVTPEVPAGEPMQLDLYWRIQAEISEDIWLSLSVGNDTNQPLVVKDGSPSAGRDTTDRWRPNVVIPSSHWVRIPEHAPAGEHAVWIGLHPFGVWRFLQPEGSPMPIFHLTEVRVRG